MGARPLDDTQAFFAARAATWDARFPDDGPAYERAAAELAPPHGGTVLDLGAEPAEPLDLSAPRWAPRAGSSPSM